MIEPDFQTKMVFPRAWEFVSAAACVILIAALVVGFAFDAARLS